MESIETRVWRALRAPVESLVVPADQLLPAAHVAEWRIPPTDITALRAWGLPADTIEFAPQESRYPTPGPRAGYGARPGLLAPGDRLYDLGRTSVWGTRRVGVVAGDGRVLETRPDHPDKDPAEPFQILIRKHEAGLPAVRLVNSSVAQFVETAWRWHAVIRALAWFRDAFRAAYPYDRSVLIQSGGIWMPPPDLWDVQRARISEYTRTRDACAEEVMAELRGIDPAAFDDHEHEPHWPDRITSYLHHMT